MQGIAVPFLISVMATGIWIAIRRWPLLTPFDLTVIFVQACVPLLAITACAAALIRSAHATSRLLVRVLGVSALGYPLWLAGWWASTTAVIQIAQKDFFPDLLNNSQAFISGVVADPGFPVLVALVIAIARILVVRRQASAPFHRLDRRNAAIRIPDDCDGMT
jgi:hypothetical protein